MVDRNRLGIVEVKFSPLLLVIDPPGRRLTAPLVDPKTNGWARSVVMVFESLLERISSVYRSE